MGFIKRVTNLIRGNLEQMISKAEDPQKMLDQSIDDMENALQEGIRAAAEAAAALKRLEKERETNIKAIELWELRAAQALQAGDEEKAKEALRQKRTLHELAKTYEQQVERQRQAQEHLQQTVQALRAKIDHAKTMKHALLARYRRAQAQKRIADMTKAPEVSSEGLSRFEWLAARIEEEELEAQAAAQLEPTLLEAEVLAATEEQELEAELSRLREQLGSPPSPKLQPTKPIETEPEPSKGEPEPSKGEKEGEQKMPPIEP